MIGISLPTSKYIKGHVPSTRHMDISNALRIISESYKYIARYSRGLAKVASRVRFISKESESTARNKLCEVEK